MLTVFVDGSVNVEERRKIESAAGKCHARWEVRDGLAEGMCRQLLQLEQTGNEAVDEGETVTKAVAPPARATALVGTSDGASAPEMLVGQLTSSTTSREIASNRSAGFKFVLVMGFGERSLQEALTHDHIAGKDFFAIRKMGSDLAHALAHVHSKNRIHADFKPLNAMRPSSTWLLIDMDVMCFIGKEFGSKQPSSGYCPPEMAKLLLAATDVKTGKVATEKLAEYKASVSYDLWSFGAVLFNLCFGTSLFNTDQNDNISLRDLGALATWTVASLNRRIDEANKPPTDDFIAAAALIKKLLVSDPDERRKSFEEGCEMSSVLKHPFFRADVELGLELVTEQLNRIENEQLKQTAMLAAIIERTETIVGLQRSTISQLN